MGEKVCDVPAPDGCEPLPGERWRWVAGFEGRYLVSSEGRVWSCRRFVRYRNGKGRHYGGHVLGSATSRNYRYVGLCRDGETVKTKTHTLVLEAFVCPRPDALVCRHLDGDPSNNRLQNLSWGTVLESNRDRRQHGTDPSGERHPGAKLRANDVRQIRRMANLEGVSHRNIANMFGVTKSTITDAVARKTWSHID